MNEILHHIGYLTDEEFLAEHIDGDGNKFSAYHYLLGFIPHDAH
ncbi:hypothetical protein [Bacillus sp. FSL K6-3431]